MWGKLAGVLIVLFILFGLFVPLNSIDQIGESSNESYSTSSSNIAITYGETTYNNENYKQIVDGYFNDHSNVNINEAKETVITANEVNKISKNISDRTYNQNQIFSCALVDLSNNDDLEINVDKSKTTLVTESMYKSALNSAGINKGYVVVTSPITATGESALAGVMQSYEKATGKTIPDQLKDVANKEIYTESQVVNDSNATPDEVANIVSEAKEQATQQNITDVGTINNIITNITQNNNINISSNSINQLADSVASTQQAQGEAHNYQSQISDYINSNSAQTLFEQIWNYITSFFDNTPNNIDTSNINDNSSNNEYSNTTN